jgi:hypothetical protein
VTPGYCPVGAWSWFRSGSADRQLHKSERLAHPPTTWSKTRHYLRKPQPSPLGGAAQQPPDGQQGQGSQAGKGHRMLTAPWASTVVVRGMAVDNQWPEIGVITIDSCDVVPVDVSEAGRSLHASVGGIGSVMVNR